MGAGIPLCPHLDGGSGMESESRNRLTAQDTADNTGSPETDPSSFLVLLPVLS